MLRFLGKFEINMKLRQMLLLLLDLLLLELLLLFLLYVFRYVLLRGREATPQNYVMNILVMNPCL